MKKYIWLTNSYSNYLLQMFLVILLAYPLKLSALEKVSPIDKQEVHLSFAPIVKKVAPAVVNIFSKRIVNTPKISPFFNDPFFKHFFDRRDIGPNGFRNHRRVQRSLGSGVIVGADGIIVTNNHVIEGSVDIEVVLHDHREFKAKILLSDEQTDIAILKVDTKGEKLPFIKFGNSDALEVGDLVLAIGNPFGVGQTVTSGIISALARNQVSSSDFQSFIQTDAAINPGNSGGALVDIYGNLIGINTAIFSRSGGSNGIGFAIPSNMVQIVVEASKYGKNVNRPWFGASLQDVTPEIAETMDLLKPIGAIITRVHNEGTADKARLQVGDVIIKLDNHEITSATNFNYRYATGKIGSKAELTYIRNGKKITSEIRYSLPQRNASTNKITLKGRSPISGAVVADLNPFLASELRIKSPQTEGVVVISAKTGMARRLRLKAGDIIMSISGQRIENINQLKRIIKERRRFWQFNILRNGRLLQITVSGR